MKDLLSRLAEVIIALALVAFTVVFLGWVLPYDSTDPPGGRSGMTIRVDHATGCEYLSRRGLTPRLDGQGRHMGCK